MPNTETGPLLGAEVNNNNHNSDNNKMRMIVIANL